MRIGIDARLIHEKGLGRYIKNLILELQALDSKNEYYVFLLKKDIEYIKLNKNFKKVLADFPWYTLKEQLAFPKLLDSYNLDIFHVPHFNVPVFYKGKMVVTIHDLIHQHIDTRLSSTHNLLFYNVKRFAYKKVFRAAVTKSQKVITVSNFVKKQLENEWNISAQKIVVTYEGVDQDFSQNVKDITKDEQQIILNRFQITPPYIFYIGNAHPHKNIEKLIQAFFKIRPKYQYLKLVLAGDDNFFWPRIKKYASNLKDDKYNSVKDIIFTGRVSDQELVALYKNAQIFATASLEEGFGLPLLEAFACVCPVVSSNKGSLEEVGGDAAVYFDPENVEDIAEKIAQVLNDNKLRQNLIEKGNKRVKDFSWKKMAKQTLEIYENNS